MRESTVQALAEAPPALAATTGMRGTGERWIAVEQNAVTGPRLKYYSRAADVAYWTELWNGHHAGWSYARETRGHLPHQLRGVVKRWVKRGGTVLEAGCGLGHFTVAACANGYRAEGVDWSSETIERLRQQFPAIRWHVGDVRRLGFSEDTFDAVYSPGVCEHFEEGPTGVLLETRRILRPGGVAIVSTPCFNSWFQRHLVPIAADSSRNDGEFYQYAFTPDGMARLLEGIGFEVVQIRPYAVLDTFAQCHAWRVGGWWAKTLALALDYVPGVRQWGSACLWVARKRERRVEGTVKPCA